MRYFFMIYNGLFVGLNFLLCCLRCDLIDDKEFWLFVYEYVKEVD